MSECTGLTAVFALGNDVYVSGSCILHLGPDGKWAKQFSDPNVTTSAIWGSDATLMYAAGVQFRSSGEFGGYILRSNGSGNWTQVYSDNSAHLLRGIYGARGMIYAVGTAGTILRSSTGDQGSWTPDTSNINGDLFGVWTSGSNDGYAVGANTDGIHPEMVRNLGGTTWQPFNGVDAPLQGVWGDGNGALYAVGVGAFYKGQ
jgi:hypothetical protein